MDLHKQMQKLADAVHGACDEMIKAKLIPEQAVPSINDMLSDNASDTKAAMRGSLVRFPKAGGVVVSRRRVQLRLEIIVC